MLQPGSYGTRVYSSDQTTQYKMYNESCDLMDRREGQDVPVFIKLSELSKEGVGQKAHLELLSVSSYNLEEVRFSGQNALIVCWDKQIANLLRKKKDKPLISELF